MQIQHWSQETASTIEHREYAIVSTVQLSTTTSVGGELCNNQSILLTTMIETVVALLDLHDTVSHVATYWSNMQLGTYVCTIYQYVYQCAYCRRARENSASRAKHGRKTSQHEDENGGFGSVVPTQTKRYLREFSTNLNETKINSQLARRRVNCDC